MAKGIAAFVFIVALVFSMTILGSVGYYASVGPELDASTQNDDVVAAANELNQTTFGEGRSSSILEGPLAVVVPVVSVFSKFITVIGNTSGVVQLLFGVPAVVGGMLELTFRIAMLITLVYLIRSGSPV